MDICYRLTAAGYSDVTAAHARLLALVEQPGVGLGHLARVAGISRQGVRQAVARLQSSEYLEMKADPLDTRAKVVALTAQGERAREVAQQVLGEAERDWAGLLEPSDWAHLGMFLDRLKTRIAGRASGRCSSAVTNGNRPGPPRVTIAAGAESVLLDIGGSATTKEITSRMIAIGRLKPGPRASTVLTNTLGSHPNTFLRVARGKWELTIT